MPRSTTFVATKRPLLGLLLAVELILAGALLLTGPSTTPAPPGSGHHTTATTTVAPPPPPTDGLNRSRTFRLGDGRTAHLLDLGGDRTAALLDRVAALLNDAAGAVTAFWGSDWPSEIVIAATGSDAQFRVLAGGMPDIAATTTGERIVFAPGAAAMSESALQIVLRHELFHYAARADTAADAPRWLTEGVADFVARPPEPPPPRADALAQLPTDEDLDTAGSVRSLAYDRAWWFSRFVADEYGTQTLRELYLRACGHGHPDVTTAVQDTLDAELGEVLTRWRHWLTG